MGGDKKTCSDASVRKRKKPLQDGDIDRDNPETNLDDDLGDPSNDIEDEWNNAIDQRFGSAANFQKPKPSKKQTSQENKEGLPGCNRRQGGIGSSQQNISAEEPQIERCFISPENKRVIAVLEGGKHKPLGTLNLP